MKKDTNISVLSRVLLLAGMLGIAANIFLPIWRIELYAPQYPEGLALKIFANRLGGDVEIINGLNHYIGMKTLHTEDFIEFSILRYIMVFFTLLVGCTALVGRRTWLYLSFTILLLFCAVSMVDFYRWNYNYGHNLDPNAAIQVPGMAYQPPLIGFKQLLNFGAYSIPDAGGWLLIAAGLLIGLAVVIESGLLKKWLTRKSTRLTVPLVISLMTLISCGVTGPQPVELNKDMCAFCRMTITDPKFATQAITAKGRHYVFDDMICLIAFGKDRQDLNITGYYVADYLQPQQFMLADNAIIIESDSLRSPMGGNYAAFANEDSALQFQEKFNGQTVMWSKLFE